MKSDKVLIIIPAYNESENIDKVLKEIKKDIKNADILVINDYSKDNTCEIVENNNVKCISNIFNMGYAMSIQTGIKYANYNNYDYVIQMDGDGQHLVSEAKKLYLHSKKSKCDITIGSRYLDKTFYYPFFRKLGTKIFSLIIRIFCRRKITDPLSGFQCLNIRAIKKYSEHGAYPEYPDASLIIEMLKQGYTIEEVKVKMRLRENGKSMHCGIIKPIKYMIEQLCICIVVIIKYFGKKGVK